MTEVKIEKGAEAQTKQATTAGAEFANSFSYLAEKAGQLSNYSDKLRISLKIVFSEINRKLPGDFEMMGEKFDTEWNEYQGEIDCYIAALPENGQFYAGLYIVSTEQGLQDVQSLNMYGKRIPVGDSSRELLKQLVKSGALIRFVQKAAEKLKAQEEEYQAVSEVAEKIAAVFTS